MVFRMFYNWLSSFFKRRLEPTVLRREEHDLVKLKTEEAIELILATGISLGIPKILHPEANKTLLIVSDVAVFETLLEIDIGVPLEELKEYKIVIFSGKYCALGAYEYIKDNKIEKAIIDLVFERTALVYENVVYRYNGIDLSQTIKNRYPGVEIVLYGSIPLDQLNNRDIKELGGGRLTGRFRQIAQQLAPAIQERVIQFYVNVMGRTEDKKERTRRIRDFVANNYTIGSLQ